METFRVHVLGCGSARPSLRHNASAQVVEMERKKLADAESKIAALQESIRSLGA